MPFPLEAGVSTSDTMLSGQATLALAGPRIIQTFERYLHVEQYPITSGANEYSIYVPLANGKAAAVVVDLSLVPALDPPFSWPIAIHAVFGIQLRVDAPKAAGRTRVYLLPLLSHRLGVQTFDVKGKSIGSGVVGPVPSRQTFTILFENPARSVVIWNADDDFGNIAVTRVERVS